MNSLRLIAPTSWDNLDQGQLKFLFNLLSGDFPADEVKTIALLRWNNVSVSGKEKDGRWGLIHAGDYYSIYPTQVAEMLPLLTWVEQIPSSPIGMEYMRRHKGIRRDFCWVPFETYIMVDNLFHGYLKTSDDSLLSEAAEILYPGLSTKKKDISPWEKIAVFYWVASLKEFFSKRYADFLRPAGDVTADGNLLGASDVNVEDAMNAQIRALTKGDITKESEVLQMDTWRALTELNAQAREYRELNNKIHQ